MNYKKDSDNNKICVTDSDGKKKEFIVSKRPWSFSAKEVSVQESNGKIHKVWVPAIVDANGDFVCYGEKGNMFHIIQFVNNEYDRILKEYKNENN